MEELPRKAEHRHSGPEARQLHGAHRRQEQIGHMLLAAEASPHTRRPRLAAELLVGKGPKPLSEQRIATMPRAELLSLSEKIMVGNSSLRQIYESHLIGERGLRRLVLEYQRGGDLKKALRTEVIEREIDFERDPAMRDLPHLSTEQIAMSGKAALDNLLEQAAASLPETAQEAAFFKARADYEAVQLAQQHKQRRLIDIVLTTAIIILISAVILLYLRGN